MSTVYYAFTLRKLWKTEIYIFFLNIITYYLIKYTLYSLVSFKYKRPLNAITFWILTRNVIYTSAISSQQKLYF